MATPFPGPVVNSGIVMSNRIPAVILPLADVAEAEGVSELNPISRDSCVSTGIRAATSLSTSSETHGMGLLGCIIHCGREMWSSIRNGGTLGVALEGLGMVEIASESQSESKAAGVQIRILLRARW